MSQNFGSQKISVDIPGAEDDGVAEVGRGEGRDPEARVQSLKADTITPVLDLAHCRRESTLNNYQLYIETNLRIYRLFIEWSKPILTQLNTVLNETIYSI